MGSGSGRPAWSGGNTSPGGMPLRKRWQDLVGGLAGIDGSAASQGSAAARPAWGVARPARGDGNAACKEQRAAREQPETRTAHGCGAEPKHAHARNLVAAHPSI